MQSWSRIEDAIIARLGVFYFGFLNYLPFLVIFSLSLIAIALFERMKLRHSVRREALDLKAMALLIYGTIAATYVGASLYNIALLLYMHRSIPSEDFGSRLIFLSKAEIAAVESVIKYLLFLLVPIIFLNKARQGFFSSIFAPVRRPVKKVVLLSSICIFAIISSAYLVSLVFGRPERSTLASVTKRLINDSPVVAFGYATLMIFMISASEELVFRGIIYSGLRERIGIPLAAVAGSILFSVYHYSALSLFSTFFFVAGMLLTLLYEQTGSIYPPIAVHASILIMSTLVGIIA